MNSLRFFFNRLRGRESVLQFDLLGQQVLLSITANRELQRAQEMYREAPLIERMREQVQPGDTIYDIGANVGLISLVLALHPNAVDASVYSFEPEPRNFHQLQRNIELNQLTGKVAPQQLALASEVGEGKLHIRGTAGEGRHSLASEAGSTDTIAVPLSTASLFASENCAAPDMVKIDVEGAEGQVLAGMAELLQAQSPRDLFLEIHPKGDGAQMPGGQEIGDWLEQLDYSVAWRNQRGHGEHRHYQYTG